MRSTTVVLFCVCVEKEIENLHEIKEEEKVNREIGANLREKGKNIHNGTQTLGATQSNLKKERGSYRAAAAAGQTSKNESKGKKVRPC